VECGIGCGVLHRGASGGCATGEACGNSDKDNSDSANGNDDSDNGNDDSDNCNSDDGELKRAG